MKPIVRTAVGVAVVLFLLCGMVLAQQEAASLNGTVTDPQGAVVPGAKVTLANPATNITRTATTGKDGTYQFVAVPPGTYRLTIEATGFRTAVRTEIKLLVATASTLDIGLEIGQAVETVEVSAVGALVNTTNSSVGNAFVNEQITQLPLEARNVMNLLSLQAGATYLPDPGRCSGAQFDDCDMRSGSVSGARSDQTNVTLDGVDVNDAQFGFAFDSALRVTPDSVQEFRVTTSGFDAQQGRSSGSQVALVTKTGTNNLHGSGYWSHRNTDWSSNEYFNKLLQLQAGDENKQPLLNKHIWGGSLGGPIIKDRLFLFGNFENLRENSEGRAERDVPSSTMRDGILVYPCENPAACPGNVATGLSGQTYNIAAGNYGADAADLMALDPLGIGASQLVSQYFQQFPSPNSPGRDALNIVGFNFSAPVETRLWTYIARADFNIDRGGNHQIFARGNLQDDNFGEAPQYPGEPPRRSRLVNNKGMVLGYTGVLSPNLVNNFRYGFTRIDEEVAGTVTENIIDFRFISDINPYTSSNARVVATHNFVDDVSWVKGNHTWQFGVNFRFTTIPKFDNANSFHFVSVNGSWVDLSVSYIPGAGCTATVACQTLPAIDPDFEAAYQDAWVDILGVLSEANAFYNYTPSGDIQANGDPVVRRFATHEWEFYGQDTWRVTPSLTLTFGLRYLAASPPWETRGFQVSPNISLGEWLALRGSNAAQGLPSEMAPDFAFDLGGPANNGPDYYSYDKNDWSPRFAFAWNPHFTEGGFLGNMFGNGDTVVRGGYSLVYDRIGPSLITRFDEAGSFGMSTNLTSPFGAHSEDDPTVRFQGFGIMPPTLPPAPPGGFPATPPFQAGAISSAFDDTITTPYAHVFNFSVGRELPWDSTFELGYVGRLGRKLTVRRDLAMPVNLVDPASGVSYFEAAQQFAILAEGTDPIGFNAWTPTQDVGPIPYWENLFPSAAGNPVCDIDGLGAAATATQVMYDLYLCVAPDYITGLWLADQFCFPACTTFGPFSYFDDQFDSLAGISSVGNSTYHGLQMSFRKRMSQGVQFDFNYTYAKSIDQGSAVERGSFFTDFFNGGYTGFLINTWQPELNRGISDFDTTHQINANWIWDLPFGRGRAWGGDMHPVADAVVGGWSLSGIWRWTSGFPFNVINARRSWPTNWNLQGNASLLDPTAPLASTETNRNYQFPGGDVRPSFFTDPAAARQTLRFSRPGEAGIRNVFRGDGFFTVDLGIGKSFTMPYSEGHKLQFRWEMFNVTNTPRFDTSFINAIPDISGTFGQYVRTYNQCNDAAGRCMQVSLRYTF